MDAGGQDRGGSEANPPVSGDQLGSLQLGYKNGGRGVTSTSWVIVLLSVDGALFLALFALLSRIEQRLARLEKKKPRPSGRAKKPSAPRKES